ncbi:MAG TPA: YadA-like family protein [Lysobacter sp.]
MRTASTNAVRVRTRPMGTKRSRLNNARPTSCHRKRVRPDNSKEQYSMNVVYRVVWNSTTNTWVVASEMAKGRKKASGGTKAIAVSGLVIAGTFAGGAQAAISNVGYLDLCGSGYTKSYTAMGVTGLNCGSAPYFDLGSGASNGIMGGPGFVTIYSTGTITMNNNVAMAANKNINMSNGYVWNLHDGIYEQDAVTLRQLKAVEAKIVPNTGTTDPNAVHYDSGTSSTRVTLAGTGGTTLANVKDGTLATGSKEGVNGGQLFATNQNVTNLTNNYNTLSTTVEGLLDDALLWDGNAYNAKHDGVDAKIANLAAGEVSATSTDAINGSQLHGTAKSVADALGGSSTVGNDGKISQPTYKVAGEDKTGVQAAIDALDARFDTIGPGADSLNWDKDAIAYNAQRDGANQRITGVASAVNANDAVNKADLDAIVGPIAPKLKYIKFGSTNAVDAFTNGIDSVAIGGNAFATSDKALAMGANANAAAVNSVAIGFGSSTSDANTFAVGGKLATQRRRIVNVADGTADSDAATVGQLNTKFAAAMQAASSQTVKGSGMLQSSGLLGATLTPTDLIKVGTTIKNGATATGVDSVAIGLEAEARQDRTIAVGNAAVAANVEAVAIGQGAVSNGVQSVAIGSQVTSFGANSIAIGTGGTQVTDTGARSTAIGFATVLGGVNTVAIGNNILSEGSNNVLLGNNASDEGRGDYVVSVGSKGGERQVIYVKSGTQDTDAVNVSQLKTAAAAIGGGSVVGPDGKVTLPTYKIGGTDTTGTLAAGISALDTRISNLPSVDALKWDTSAYTAKHGGVDSKVTNLAAGTVATGSTEAVNGSQLYATNNAVSGIIGGKGAGLNADGSIKAPTFAVSGSDKATVGDAIAALDAKTTTITTDALLWNTNAYSAKHGGVDSKIANLAAGTVGATSTEAINGSQLHGTAKSVADALGGSSTVGADGTITQPTYKVAGVDKTGVQAAIAALDAKTTTITTDALMWDGTAYNAKRGGVDQRITGVASAVNANDAVNKGDLETAIAPYKDFAPKLKYIKFGATSAVDAYANGNDALAIGGNAFATADKALAVGANANVGAANSVAVGFGSIATDPNTFAVGGKLAAQRRRIVNVANGVADSDAATVGQLNAKFAAAMQTASSQAVKGSGMLQSSGLLGATLTPTDLIKVGTTIKNGATATGVDSVAIGLEAEARQDRTIAVGNSAVAANIEAVAIGQGAISNGVQSVAIGSQVTSFGENSIAIGTGGTQVTDTGTRSVAIGFDTVLGGEDTVAIGNNILSEGSNNVLLGNNSSDEGRGNNVVSVGSKAAERQVIYVKAGTQDTDAVNVSQLKTAAAAIGGGSVVGPDGKVTMPTYKIGGKDVTGTLADGISALDDRITGVNPGDPLAVSYDGAAKDSLTLGGVDADGKPATEPVKLTNVAAATGDTDAVNLGQLKDAGIFDDDGSVLDAVVYDKDSNKAKVSFGGAEGTVLENVAAGTVSAASKQAINGSQLFGTAKSVADALGGGSSVGTDGKIASPVFHVGGETAGTVSDAVDKLDDRIDGVSVGVTDALKWDATAAGGAYSAKHGDQATSRITNVAEATQATDAVNKGQFDRAIQELSTRADPLSVKYDGMDKAKVTLGGTGATTAVKLTNVAAGTQDTDAINVKQLKDAGLIGPEGKTLDAVVYDANSQRASVTFGGVNGTTLNNVADGMINRDSRQAVNGGQIFQLKEQLNQQITNIDARVTHIEENGGGGAHPYIAAVPNRQQVPVNVGEAVGAAERIPEPADAGTSPGVAVGYDSVATGVEASALGDHATAYAANSLALGNHASVQESATNSVALGKGSIASTANTVSIGSAGAERTISNVARGNADTDAVNVSQLHDSLSEAKAYADTRLNDVWDGLAQEVDEVNRQANRGIAAASALINVTPYVPGHVTMNAGLANYRGETALGVGVSRWSDNGRLNLNAGVSAAKDDDPVIRVGIGYIF